MVERAGPFFQFLKRKVYPHLTRNAHNAFPNSAKFGVAFPVAIVVGNFPLDPSPARSYVFRRIGTGFRPQDAGLIPQAPRRTLRRTYKLLNPGFFEIQSGSCRGFGRIRTRLPLVVCVAANSTINKNGPVFVRIVGVAPLYLVLPALCV